MKDIKTCEQYVLNELEKEQRKVAELKYLEFEYSTLLDEYNGLKRLINEVGEILSVRVEDNKYIGEYFRSRDIKKLTSEGKISEDYIKVVHLFGLDKENKEQ